ncbi:MAG: hypothetical protein AAFX53_17515 [Bacteroidota bacterium]
MFSFQLWEGIRNTNDQVDETEYLRALPFIFPVLGVLFFLSSVIRRQIQLLDIYETVTKESERLLHVLGILKNDNIQGLKKEIETLKTGLSKKNAQERMNFLHKIKEELEEKLKP